MPRDSAAPAAGAAPPGAPLRVGPVLRDASSPIMMAPLTPGSAPSSPSSPSPEPSSPGSGGGVKRSASDAAIEDDGMTRALKRAAVWLAVHECKCPICYLRTTSPMECSVCNGHICHSCLYKIARPDVCSGGGGRRHPEVPCPLCRSNILIPSDFLTWRPDQCMESVSETCSGKRCGFTVTERVKIQADPDHVDKFGKITGKDFLDAKERARAHIKMHESSCQFMPAKLCPEAIGMSIIQIRTHLESCPKCLGGFVSSLVEDDGPDIFFD